MTEYERQVVETMRDALKVVTKKYGKKLVQNLRTLDMDDIEVLECVEKAMKAYKSLAKT